MNELLFEDILNYINENPKDHPTQKETAAHFSITPQYLCRLFKKNLGLTYREYLSSSDRNTKHDTIYNHAPTLTTVSSFHASWNKLINLGYSAQLEGHSIALQIQSIQKILNFQFGRVCQITQLIHHYTLNGCTTYNYSAVFNLLDLMLENHLRPCLELGYKTFYIHTTTKEAYGYGPESARKHFETVLDLLPGLLKACINRYGQQETNSWCFEIGYPYITPDTNSDLTFYNYITYYEKLYDTLRKYVPLCKIGAPGFNDWTSDNSLQNTLTYLADTHRIPDFFSAYLYNLNKDIGISNDTHLLYERLEFLENSVHRIFPDTQIWITEFNSNLSSRNHINDSVYQSVFLLKTLLEASSLKIDAMGYYLLSDLSLRYSDSLNFLFGGWGLFSDTNIPKPSFHAYRIISLLGRHVIENKPGFFVSFDSPGNYQLLFYHYELPLDYYQKNNISLDSLKSETCFWNSDHTETHHITLNFLPSGVYLIKEFTISETKGNLLTEWKKINYLTPYRKRDLNDLKNLSALTPELSTVSINHNSPLFFSYSLNPNEAILVTIDLYKKGE